MSYPYAVTPYIQTAMAQAMQAVFSGSPLPPNCYIVAMPMQQAQQLFPQIMMNFAANGGAGVMMFAQQSSFYGLPYSSNAQYPENIPNNAVVPYQNYYPQGYNTNYNYPIVPYNGDSDNKSKKKTRESRKKTTEPHSNVYNSSSFDSYMRHLSWSRLFERHHNKEQMKDQAALSYDQKSTPLKKQRSQSANSSTLSSLTSSSSSSSTTSDETIRRVDVSTKQSNGTSSSTKQQVKSSLPFKYSSEFIPGTGKEQTSKPKKESKVKIDDVFVIKKPPTTPPPTSQQ
ncbi:hypothetical protein I4U23_028122 [Adineta vaga]|nr:hypothetical protein I4U23_028122 [Adineta vaga]